MTHLENLWTFRVTLTHFRQRLADWVTLTHIFLSVCNVILSYVFEVLFILYRTHWYISIHLIQDTVIYLYSPYTGHTDISLFTLYSTHRYISIHLIQDTLIIISLFTLYRTHWYISIHLIQDTLIYLYYPIQDTLIYLYSTYTGHTDISLFTLYLGHTHISLFTLYRTHSYPKQPSHMGPMWASCGYVGIWWVMGILWGEYVGIIW